MPLLIRELNIKVDIGRRDKDPEGAPAPKDRRNTTDTVQRAVEEVLRIEEAKRER